MDEEEMQRLVCELEARLRRLMWGVGTSSGGERLSAQTPMPRD